MVENSYIRQGKKSMLKLITFCVCLCAVSLQTRAQEDVQMVDIEEPKWKAENFGFNAIDLRQTRFLYGDSAKYRNEKFYDNLSIGLVWRLDRIHARTSPGYYPELSKSFYIGKEIDRLQSLRLLLSKGTYQQMESNLPLMEKYQAELLYSFNWTRYFGGYTPYRKIEAVTNVGLGAFYSEQLNQRFGAMFIVGAGARMQLSPTISVGIEPYAALATDNIDNSFVDKNSGKRANFHGYDVAYGADVSLAYTFHNRSFIEEVRSRFAGNAFVDFGLGAQFLLASGFYGTQGMPFLSSADPALRLGLGYWFSPGFALRATANLSSNSMESDGTRFKNVMASGRLDALFNPYRYFTGRSSNRFNINAIAGWEYGYMVKYDPNAPIPTTYDGLSAGLQFRYDYDKNTALYIEPRVTLTGFDVEAKDKDSDYSRDYLFSLTAGLEYAINEYSFLGREQQPSSFNPHISFSLLGGANYLFTTHGQDGWGYSAGLAGEMQITPYSGVRVMFDRSSLYGSDINMNNFSADYVFDLGTLLQGYDKANHWDVALAAGPVVSQSKELGKGDLGMQVGIPVSYRLTPRLELLFEPRGRLFFNDYVIADNGLSGGNANKMLSAQLGLRYSLNDHFYVAKDSLHEKFEAEPGHLFAHIATGAQTPYLSQLGFYHMGPRVEAGLGYWFNPGLAARGSIILASHDLNRELPAERQMSFSGRVDVMLDPFGYLANRYDRLFGFNFIGGLELGRMSRGYSYGQKEGYPYSGQHGNNYMAFSAGAQLRYNYDGYHALYLEPRYTMYRAGTPDASILANSGSYYSLVAGMELGATEYAFRFGKSQPGEFSPTYSFALLGGLGYVYGAYTKTSVFDLTGGLAAEYKYSPYSGVRLTANYSNYHVTREIKKDYINFGVDYMFDITTLLQGYTYDRKWNAALALGPAVGYRVATSEDANTKDKFGIGAQVGVPVSYNIDNSWAIMFEPRGKVYHKHLFGGSGLLMEYDALLGMKYTPNQQLYDHLDELNQAHDVRREFINYSMGLQYAGGTDLGFGSTGGVQFGLGYGRWMNSLLGVRFGVEMAASHLMRNSDYPDILQKTARLGARADMMLNPLALSSGYTPSRWGTALLLGWELGGKIGGAYDGKNPIYNSFSLGAQLRYHTDENHALYIEPRYMVDDKLVSLTAGMEYAMTEHRFLLSKNQPGEFSPYYSVGVAGGLSHVFLTGQPKGISQLGYNAGVSGEYHFTPYSGFRFTLGYADVNNGANERIGHLNTSFDYMFDLSTLFAGYTPGRRWDVSLAAGPVFSTRMSNSDQFQFLGAQVGVPVQYRFNRNLGVSLEPRVRVYPLQNSISSNGGMSEVVDLQVGMEYTPGENFYDRMEDLNDSHDSRHDFVNYAIGLQYPSGRGSFGSTAGMQLGLGAGRWINSLLGVRLGAEIAASRPDSGEELQYKSTRIGGRADVLFNPLALSSGYTPSRWGAAMLLGWELGYKLGDFHYRGSYYSLGLGAQLRYHTDENHALYIEPRYMLDDRLVSLTAGMEYAMTEYRFRSSKNQPGVFRPYYSVNLAAGVSHPFPFRATEAGMPLLGNRPTIGLSGEYHFTPYSGIRLNAGYAKVNNQNNANIGIDYMFDLSTLFAGYTPDRRWDVMLAAGPLFNMNGLERHVGAQVGIPVQYRFNENWGISLEPRARALYRYRLLDAGLGTPSRYEIFDLLLGMKYTIDQERFGEFVRDTKDDFIDYVRETQKPKENRFFTDLGMGVITKSGMSAGPRATASLGYWLNSDFALRGSLLFSSYNWKNEEAYDYNAAVGAARLDLVVNPLNFFMGRSFRQFDVNALAGMELGTDLRYHSADESGLRNHSGFSYAPSLGLQLLYNQSDTQAFYLEPRYVWSNSEGKLEGLFALTGGMYFTTTDYAFRSKARQPERFVPRFSMSLSAGLDMPVRLKANSGASAFDFVATGLTGEYRFGPYSGLRMAFNYNTPSKKDADYSYLSLSADYLFDFTTLMRGYTSDRKWDVGIAVGPVYGFMSGSFEDVYSRKHRLGGQLSIPVTYNVNDCLGISFEPRGRAFIGGVQNSRYNLGYNDVPLLSAGAQLGLKYTIDKYRFEDFVDEVKKDFDSYKKKSKKEENRFFTDLGLGMQMLAASGKSAGPRATASLGCWLNSDFALRGSLLFSSYKVDENQNTAAGAARMDLMVSPLNFFMGRSFRQFDINALAGWEIGKAYRSGSYPMYNAFSTGLQLLYNQSSSQAFYLEPRYIWSNSEGVRENLWAVTGGMYFTASDYAFRSKARQPERFVPRLSLALSGGVDLSVRPTAFTPDFATGVTGELRFGPYSGLRMALNHNTYSNRISDMGAEIGYQANYLSLSADYLFDFTTLLRGYTTDRKWNVGVAFGPVVCRNISSSSSDVIADFYIDHVKKIDAGAQLSVPVSYNINEKIGILFEPRGRAYIGDYVRLRKGNIESLDWNGSVPYLQAGAQLGLKYTLGNKIRVKSQEESKTRDFVNLAMGMQLLSDAGIDFGQTGGLQVGAGIGRWVTPAWGVRLSGEFAASNKNYDENNHSMSRTVRLGGRMDMMLNPFALNAGYKPTRWEAALLAGFECGLGAVVSDYRTYNSLSAGAQLRYNTNEKHVLYVEPRYSLGENQFSVTAGLEFSMTEHRFRSSKKQTEEFKPYFSMGLSGGLSHNSFSRVTYNGMPSFAWGLSGEYHFTSYSGARLTYSGDLSSVGFDYMFDLSTLFAGYTSDRRLDVALAAGPVVGKQVKGGQLGVPVKFHLNGNWGISLEPRARVFLSNSLGLPRMDMNFQMGVKYTF